VISEAKFFEIHFQGNSRATFCSIEQAGVIRFAQQHCRISPLRTALPVQQAASRKITGAKKYDTRLAVQQRDNWIGKKKSPAEAGLS